MMLRKIKHLPAIYLIGTLFVALILLVFNYIDIPTLIVVATGNYFVEVLFNLPFYLPVLVMVIFMKVSLFNSFIMLSLALMLLSVISQLVYPLMPVVASDKWQYIRSSVGFSFVSYTLSIYLMFKAKEIKWYYYLGGCSIIAMLIILPYSLEINNVTLLMFRD